jgi:hypothetical protein
MDYTDAEVKRVADTFVESLREDLSKEEFRAMCAANADETDTDVCHSHDYLDSNENMMAAVEDVLGDVDGRIVGLTDDHGDYPEYADWFIELWNTAWTLAKADCIALR